MSLDPREYDEVICPDCHRPYVISLVEGQSGTYRIDGSLCPGKDVINLPTGIVFALERGPMTFYKKRGAEE